MFCLFLYGIKTKNKKPSGNFAARFIFFFWQQNVQLFFSPFRKTNRTLTWVWTSFYLYTVVDGITVFTYRCTIILYVFGWMRLIVIKPISMINICIFGKIRTTMQGKKTGIFHFMESINLWWDFLTVNNAPLHSSLKSMRFPIVTWRLDIDRFGKLMMRWNLGRTWRTYIASFNWLFSAK